MRNNLNFSTALAVLALCQATAFGASGKDSAKADSRIIGTWTVHQNGVENRSIRMVFENRHKFKFVCSGAKSEGTYELADDAIYLTYTKVDGERVNFDSKKRLPIGDAGSSFQVDTYRYERASH